MLFRSQRAGFADDYVVECHGSIHHLQCLRGGCREIWPADGVVVRVDEPSTRAVPPLPSCPRCRGLARPNILMFGDRDWLPVRTEARAAEQVRWLRELRAAGARLVVLEIGAGTAVPTVRRHAELASAGSGALIRINTREPAVRHGRGVSIGAPARDALQALAALVN